jgi:DNA (cytosine-5)-methyltransferase 1
MVEKMQLRQEKLTLIDLFCGCGGFTEGFLFGQETNAKRHWGILLGVDNNPVAIETFNANFREQAGRLADLNGVHPCDYLLELNMVPGELDHLHASPPCEAYSVNNRVNGHNGDYRFRIALNWAEAFLPKVFSLENVRNLGKAHDAEIRRRLRSLGYQVISFKVDAADYGVPQHRKRLFYLAFLTELGIKPFPPEPTHCDPLATDKRLKPWITVKRAIGDLPARKAGEGPDEFISDFDPEDPTARSLLSEYAAMMRPRKGELITGHSSRPLNELALKRIRSLAPGQAIWDLPENLRPKMGFRGAYGKLHPDYPAKTITTGIRGPSHGPFSHYSQDRLITFREAARLQSFPDSFVFKGNRSSQASQIGNAVPPLLARAIKEVFEKMISCATAKSLVLA